MPYSRESTRTEMEKITLLYVFSIHDDISRLPPIGDFMRKIYGKYARMQDELDRLASPIYPKVRTCGKEADIYIGHR